MIQVTNKQIAEIFKKSKKFLALTIEDEEAGLTEFLCVAIASVHHHYKKHKYDRLGPEFVAARNVIHKRIAPYSTLCEWLDANGVTYSEQSFTKLQKHRLAWLEILIEEFDKD